jgi:hypothetical protein
MSGQRGEGTQNVSNDAQPDKASQFGHLRTTACILAEWRKPVAKLLFTFPTDDHTICNIKLDSDRGAF